jgi:hypothetical protein
VPCVSSPVGNPENDPAWFFYVADNPRCRFVGNAFAFDDLTGEGLRLPTLLEPGVSFFDREDQQDLFKLHLPYIWRTAPEIDTLFLPLLNRAAQGLEVQCGLVETEWYSNPVNLILRKPARAVHFHEGDLIAHAVLVRRDLRKPSIEVAANHSRLARESRRALGEWHRQHAEDRGAYKVLARSRDGRIEP